MKGQCKKKQTFKRENLSTCKQVTTRLFENASNLEDGAELKLLDYSFDSDDDIYPCIYCNEPFNRWKLH